MSGCYYDPFTGADIYSSEEEYFKDLAKEQEREMENGKKRINESGRKTNSSEREQ